MKAWYIALEEHSRYWARRHTITRYLLKIVTTTRQHMNITEVRIKKNISDSPVKAFASITIDDAIVVHDVKVIEGKNGLFIAMPCKKVGDRYLDVSHPITAHSRSVLVDTVLNEYKAIV